MKNEGIFKGLVEQIDKIANYNNQGSYKTRQRYYEAVKRFIDLHEALFRRLMHGDFPHKTVFIPNDQKSSPFVLPRFKHVQTWKLHREVLSFFYQT